MYTTYSPFSLSVSNLGNSNSIDDSEDALGALCAPYARVLYSILEGGGRKPLIVCREMAELDILTRLSVQAIGSNNQPTVYILMRSDPIDGRVKTTGEWCGIP